MSAPGSGNRMDESKGTPLAVMLSAILHLGIVRFCSSRLCRARAYDFVNAHCLVDEPDHLYAAAAIAGAGDRGRVDRPTGSPPPKSVKTKPVPNTVPPPPAVPPPPTPQPKRRRSRPCRRRRSIRTSRIRSVWSQDALQKGRRRQESCRKRKSVSASPIWTPRRPSASRKSRKKVDELFKQDGRRHNADQKAHSKAKQAKQQKADLANASAQWSARLAQGRSASERQQRCKQRSEVPIRGGYSERGHARIGLRPDNMPNVPCTVDIVQLPGGDVMSAKVDSAAVRMTMPANVRSKMPCCVRSRCLTKVLKAYSSANYLHLQAAVSKPMRNHFDRCFRLVLLLMAGDCRGPRRATDAQRADRRRRQNGHAVAVVPFAQQGGSPLPTDIADVIRNDFNRSGKFRSLASEIVEQPSRRVRTSSSPPGVCSSRTTSSSAASRMPATAWCR
jgi:colicin import membrane protein